MNQDKKLQVLVDGLKFPESPRWHDDRLWISDFRQRAVFSVGLDGDVATVVEVPNSPSGLGWLQDGSLLIVSMADQRLMKLLAGALTEVAVLSALVRGHCNDMVVDAVGRAYIGSFGFDLLKHESPCPGSLARVDPDGSAKIAATDLLFPNGMVITPDGRNLIVAETFGNRLSAYDIAADGALTARRVFAQLYGCFPDGICLDAEGAVWVADASDNRVLRVIEGRGVVDSISTGRHKSYACMLGGQDGRTLFICTAPGIDVASAALQEGRIEFTKVDVPHAGLP